MAVPIPRPGKIVCVGLNYRDHAEEQGAELPAAPLLFAKFTTSLIGPGDPIVVPPLVTKCDYEAELGVVLAQTVKRVSKENALEAVAGYLVANDVSARDLQFGDGQWTRGKSPDTFCPVGPLVPVRFFSICSHNRVRYLRSRSISVLLLPMPAVRMMNPTSFGGLSPSRICRSSSTPRAA